MTHSFVPPVVLARGVLGRTVAIPPLHLRALLQFIVLADPRTGRLVANRERLLNVTGLPDPILEHVLDDLADRGLLEVIPVGADDHTVVLGSILVRTEVDPASL